MVKEKLINGDTNSILELLCQTSYGEHNILIYPDLDAFREIYTHVCKARLEKENDAVMLLPHYETVRSAQEALRELDIDVKARLDDGSLQIIDSSRVFFNPQEDFVAMLKRAERDARQAGRSGVIVIVDMASFYHRQMMIELVRHEHSMPAKDPDVRYSVFCCYHFKDFQRFTEAQKEQICENHYNNLFIRET